ncbi:MAG TPA: PIN domain-containing protein, partial [Ilumatobacter sp.]|nr:PIN domain-containing protein [Ilumatobacter sp.]
MIHYIDTSAYLKLFIDEPESAALSRHLELGRARGHRVVSSVLLETELRRAGHRYGLARDLIDAEVAKLTLISAADSTFHRAGAFPDPLLRSLDALHLATA